MRTLVLLIVFALVTGTTFAQEGQVRAYQVDHPSQAKLDSLQKLQAEPVKLIVDGNNAYYQRVVKVDTNIMLSSIYVRSLQFMASKNFTQTYGYEEEGKLIFTTTQDLNENDAFNDNEGVDPYTVQFAVTIDMKNRRYRYTIHNVVFYRPTESGNRRVTLFDMYQKETQGDSRRISKDAKKLIDSFERYVTGLTNELYENIEQKAIIHNTKF